MTRFIKKLNKKLMKKKQLKSKKEIEIMFEGGRRLSQIKAKVVKAIKPEVSAYEIEEFVTKLISEAGGQPSFRMVPGYHWSTCVNVNEGVVHGIPHKNIIFKRGDLVSVDMGIYYEGFHTDTSVSVYLGSDPVLQKFMEVGQKALKAGIEAFRLGNKVGDISQALGKIISSAGYSPIENLTGHGIGRSLHEYPGVPCKRLGVPDEEVELEPGLVLAIEIMYAQGRPELKLEKDGWTLSTKDGKIAALFEETVALTNSGRIILTN